MPKLNPLLAVVEATLLEPKAAKAGREGADELLPVESPKEKGAAAEVGLGFSVLAAPKPPKAG